MRFADYEVRNGRCAEARDALSRLLELRPHYARAQRYAKLCGLRRAVGITYRQLDYF